MLRGLDIRDMLLIDRLTLEFQPGLNVLTGETGAGKSILLDSLGFVLGWRGRAELVRQGAERGEVTAAFDLPQDHPAFEVLRDADIEVGDELLLRRVNTVDGRKTAWINDRRVSGDILRRLSDTLVELHGQHDDRGLLDPKGHRALLDAFGDHTALLIETSTRWRAVADARRTFETAEAALDALRAEEEYLRHAVKELEALSPEPGEDAELDTRRRRMQAGERIRQDLSSALQALGSDGAEGPMLDAARWLDAAAPHAGGSLDEAIEALGRAMHALAEAEQGTARALDALDADPAELERVEERLFELRALARKHDVPSDELSALAETLRARLDALDGGADDLETLQAALRNAEAAYGEATARLTAARERAASALDEAMRAELAPLKMERAIFGTRIGPAPPGPTGTDIVEFTVATNPGAPAGPLGKIASGGELSRFLLALKVCLTRQERGLTLIFDEIDRGVGGATADAVGRRLSALSEGAQVIVVTHSPQVAALGAHHWRVAKQVENDRTTTNVTPLDPTDRIDEVARMLSGDKVTDAAREAAKTLLAG